MPHCLLERAEHFEAIVAADHDVSRAKPAPTLYVEALDQLELGPEEAIAFANAASAQVSIVPTYQS